ncbi:MAG: permease-like cell division protein FtsX [Gammaproteobacteria bacterium]|nr:permease-like cell division protein FtsX [Gammaproteobacteria bacterium]MDH5309685.1 permease-like cell division protein FtsX [Gammaproteobacteria bacterium]
MRQHRDALSAARRSSPLTIWLSRHASNCLGALGRIARQPFASFLTILVIAVTLALPASMHLVIKNARSVSGGWDSALDFSLYLKPGVTRTQAERLADIIEQRADVETVTLIPADEALAEFKAQSGFGAALDHLAENPLPHTLVVRPGSAMTGLSVTLLNEELANLPETDFVQVDTEWVQRFLVILDMLQRAITIGSLLLGAAIIVIIGNTIRLDIQNRREEIEVTKLIGASNAFVRRPFLYSGLWYGLGGGTLALILVGYGVYMLDAPAGRLAGLYNSAYRLLSLDLRESLAIIGTGVLLGLVGSWLAVARHLRRIEPR